MISVLGIEVLKAVFMARYQKKLKKINITINVTISKFTESFITLNFLIYFR